MMCMRADLEVRRRLARIIPVKLSEFSGLIVNLCRLRIA